MAQAGFRILGLAKLLAQLGTYEAAVDHATLERIEASARRIKNEAQRRAPVDTGRLRASIQYQVFPDRNAARVGTDVEYAPYVEFGTRRMAAQPFLFPAVEQERRDLILGLVRGLNGAARQVA